jgi:PAS domain S-box-containing protein
MAVALRNMQHAVNLCQEVIFFSDPAGMIERVNPAFEELTGYSSVEAVGQDLSWIAADGPMSDTYRRIWEQVFQDRAFRGNLRVRRKQRDPCELDVLIAPVRDNKGGIASLLCTGRDTSEKCELETQLSSALRMDAIGTLAGGVAHDFNNMLMVISAHSELALIPFPRNIGYGVTWRRSLLRRGGLPI